MIPKKLYRLAGMIAVLLSMLPQANAQFREGTVMTTIGGYHELDSNHLVNGAQSTASYTLYNGNDRIINVITLKIDEGKTVYYASNFTARVSLTLIRTDKTGAVDSIHNVKLQVNYDSATGAKFTARDYKTYMGYTVITVRVDTILVTGYSAWQPLGVLEVTNEIMPVRYYDLSSNPSHLIPTLTTSQPTADVLQLSWYYPSAAQENMTQLEWSYVEKDMLSFYNGNTDLLFNTNSARVDLDQKDTTGGTPAYRFKIPYLFPDTGRLYYRTRAAHRKENGTLIAGAWTLDSFAVADGHQTNLNWQSNTSFAEGGKYKTVIQYFDGSLRGRQTVTKDNSTGNTIVGETIYDLQGRPNVQILPTPTIDNTIQYFVNFNRFNGMSANDDPAKYFDLTPESVKCDTLHSLSNAYGNGKYYSSNNDWLASETKSMYIPDAQGFAYTETRFTDDATQRVKQQGGVGLDHQIGMGHETKYFYGKPAQPELDALFGTEAGDASHYSKNMVQDANGQLSVSYTDMHGRTVATALAGNPTSGIDSIINSADYPLSSGNLRNDLLTTVTNIVQGSSIVSVSTILVDANNTYDFTYKLTPAILHLLDCSSQAVCFDCKYNLEISIKGENCTNDSPIVRKYNNLQLVSSSQCSTPMGFVGEGITTPVTQIDFSAALQPGSYVVRKTLTINDSLFQKRRDSALNVLLCKTENTIYNHIYDSLSVISGCGAPPATSCDSCKAKLHTFSVYKTNYLAAVAPQVISDSIIHLQYTADSLECENACGNGGLVTQFSTLKVLRDQMLRDMMPYTGQYATDTIKKIGGVPDSTSLDAHYNIFTDRYYVSGSPVTTNKPYYKHPLTQTGATNYYTEDNLVDTTIQSSLSTISKDSFATIFQESWATSLITRHPEYSKLRYADTALQASYSWLDSVLSCPTYALAYSKGYTVPVKISTSTINDPYFLRVSTSADKDTIDHKLYNGLMDSVNGSGVHFPVWRGPTIWQIANGSVLCNAVDSALRMACIMATNATGIDGDITTTADKDKAWETFRTVYLSLRNDMVLRYINQHAPSALSQADMDKLTKNEGKQLIFAAPQDVANQNGYGDLFHGLTNPHLTDTTGLAHYIDTTHLDNCTGQRPFWRARLLQCDSLRSLLNNGNSADSLKVDTVINKILDSMVMVCHNSITPTQPYGASSVNPSYGGYPRNFDSVINHVLTQYGMNTRNHSAFYFCNPFTIDFPKPFGSNIPVTVNYSNQLDSCNCKRFTTLKTEAASLGYNPYNRTSMNQYLLVNYSDTLSQVLWNGLQHCSTSYEDTCCPSPEIESMTLESGGDDITYINVSYELLQHCDSCIIYRYTMSNVLVDSVKDICGTSNTLFPADEEDPCTEFKFLIKCYKHQCGVRVSDTAIFQCPERVTHGGGGGLGCTPPHINSAVISQSGKSFGILVSYSLPTTCDVCRLYVYDYSNSLLLMIDGICGTTSQFLTTLDTCGHYKFLVKCTSATCSLLVSDTAYYNKTCSTDSCTHPHINSVVHVGADNYLHLNYTLPGGCDSCKLIMYSGTSTQLAVLYGICGTTDTTLLVDDTCNYYKFQIVCYSPSCPNIKSDTAIYSGCHPSCELPYFTAVGLKKGIYSDYYVQLHYVLPHYCDSCRIYMYNDAGSLLSQHDYICSTSDTTMQIYDTCAAYKFVIKCDNFACGERISDTAYYYRPCANTDICMAFKNILMTDFTAIPAFLNCGYTTPCVTCAKLKDTLTPQFRTMYSSYSGVPYLDSATDDQSKQNALWARFLNYRTGFSKSTMEYLTAYKNCAATPPTITALCGFDKPLNDPSSIFIKDTVPCKGVITQAQFITQLIFNHMKDSLVANFDSLYKLTCLSARENEQFYVTYKPKEYHYTLYYYDQAGNLVKTIPPAAVRPNYSSTFLDSVVAARIDSVAYPNYRNNSIMATQYRYNSLNQVVAQHTPDAGTSNFWYDRLGRLVLSQNSKQQPSNKYSYTLYDVLGRITQVGEKQQTQTLSQDTTQSEVALKRWLDDIASGGSLKQQITRTVYDVSYYNGNDVLGSSMLVQRNLRNRVSYTQLIDQEPADFATNDSAFLGLQSSATFYSYDIHGNVDTLLQDLKGAFAGSDAGNRFKKMVYDYDLVSGKVNKVAYQTGLTDQFYHVYNYDDENRIVSVSTSQDSIYWETEATYEYYRHGPLSRTLLGANHIQGIDYAYTIQGWLKGVNATALSSGVYDMGKDGAPSGNLVARDAFGFSLNYFYNDYKPVNAGSGGFITPFVSVTNSLAAASDGVELGKDLFNGNIRAMMVNVPKLSEAKLYGYRYDQLNRIKAMNSFNGFNNSTNLFSSSNNPSNTEDYRERVSYDPNGNILKYVRHGAAALGGGLSMDSLTYGYNFNGSGYLLNNKLRHVKDPVSSGNYTEDIDNQSDDNYAYDSIGNLIADAQAGISSISWTVYGKIKKIIKNSGDSIVYSYDASGNRISKWLYSSGTITKTMYVRDASGNVMSLYTKDATINSGTLSQTEISMYGSSRLGVWNVNRMVDSLSFAYLNFSGFSGTFIRGNKLFELTNHLGNVLATISDKHIGVDSNSNGVVDYYIADVVTANDYYPFGMTQPGRKYSNGSGYRYGFNGKENDKDISEGGQDFGDRIYDGKLGKWLTSDRLTNAYPSISPYAYAINSPIEFYDPNGKWVAKVDYDAANKRYSLTFVAEKGDNLKTLAIQLGIPETSLVKSDPTLKKVTITTATELKLEKINEVQTINKALNSTYDNSENCANLSAACSNTDLPIQFDNIFGAGGGNTETFADDLADKKQFTSVPESNTKIGSVTHYRLDNSYVTDQIKEAQKIIDQDAIDVKANPKLKGMTPADAKKLLDDAKAKAENIVKNERHFSTVILKDKTGTKIKQIIQKAGNTPFNHAVVPASASRQNLPYSPKPVKGTKFATYNKN